MDVHDINLDEETILNNIKNMYNGDWDDMLEYYNKVIKCKRHNYFTVCDKAALNGHLEILKYAHENGCPWNEWTCALAAHDGHLEVLKYAHENGCPWNERTCSIAAYNGHLEVLKYAHENGCPWNELICAWAACKGDLEVLYYLYENEAPYDTRGGVHPNCKEFFDTFGEHWKKGDFSLMHHLKPAKNK